MIEHYSFRFSFFTALSFVPPFGPPHRGRSICKAFSGISHHFPLSGDSRNTAPGTIFRRNHRMTVE